MTMKTESPADAPLLAVFQQEERDLGDMLTRVRANLKRWAARYAASEHAKAHVKETLLLVQEIDERLLRR